MSAEQAVMRTSLLPNLVAAVARKQSLGNLGPSPLLFRDSANMTAPSFSDTPVFPNSGLITNSVNAFDPNIQVPYADTWSFGVQRGITKNMAAEVRYVDTRARQQWTNYNYNEVNIIENGVLDEFKLAQANLQANVAAGRGGNFRYYGPGTGTSPLPSMLAYFSGSSDATNPARYGSTSTDAFVREVSARPEFQRSMSTAEYHYRLERLPPRARARSRRHPPVGAGRRPRA